MRCFRAAKPSPPPTDRRRRHKADGPSRPRRRVPHAHRSVPVRRRQAAAVGNQVAGRVGFFLEVDDFDAGYERMVAEGVEFVDGPRAEPYGRVAVFLDIAGNRWDLLGPAPAARLTGPKS